jgi:DNA helicase-2/ATP-dependent DNA helicase PcrA
VSDKIYRLPGAATDVKAAATLLGDLNTEQRQAVEAADGPSLIIAGAGTGKTRTLVYRLSWLIARGVPPDRVLLLTFTNKAAKEMLSRAEKLLGGASRRVVGGTFHHVGNVILRQHAERLGYSPAYNVIDPGDAKDLMTSCVAELGLAGTTRRFPRANVLLRAHSYAVNTGRPFGEVLALRYPQHTELAADAERACTRYMERKVRLDLVDYDDLLLGWKILLDDHPDIAEQVRSRFSYVLVDEYQDTNLLQGSLVDAMVKEHRNVMVVGDDCQAIYSFRGASFDNILGFPKRYEGCRVIRLTRNYRSTPEILAAANRSIANNRKQFEKQLVAERKEGPTPAVISTTDSKQQAAFVAHRVLELRNEGVPLNEMAVLYRAHRHAVELQVELRNRRIPFVVRSGMRFFEQAHIKDVVAHLRVLHNPRDELAWIRILRLQPHIGDTLATRLAFALTASADPLVPLATGEGLPDLPRRASATWDTFRRRLTKMASPESREVPGTLIDQVLSQGYEDHLRARFANPGERTADIRTLAGYAASFDGLRPFLDEISGTSELSGEGFGPSGPSDDEFLILSSVHQAKGLEWDAVFVIGLADGLFPLAGAFGDDAELEEERRLFYVAVTRARTELHLAYPIFGPDRRFQTVLKKPSLFLRELEGEPVVFERWRVEEG